MAALAKGPVGPPLPFEFGVVALPFVLLLFGILSVCLSFFYDLHAGKRGAGHSHRQVQQSQGELCGREHERGPQEAL